MVKVELLKSFGIWGKGTVRAVSNSRADYWMRVGIAKMHISRPKVKEKEKDTEKSKVKSNDKSGATNKGKGKPKS